MPKQKQDNEPEATSSTPETENAKIPYFFPNQDFGQPFSVEADSQDAAIKANDKYLEQLKKETS